MADSPSPTPETEKRPSLMTPTAADVPPQTVKEQRWVVVVGEGSVWATCYGTWTDYEAVVEWVRGNGWHPSNVSIHPIKEYARAR
jgi:hypothetical protein